MSLIINITIFNFLRILLNYIIYVLPLLINIVFYILMERRVLGVIQRRKGPSKVGLLGLFQSFADVIKLLYKHILIAKKSYFQIYILLPIYSILLAILGWFCIPFDYNSFFFSGEYDILYILMISIFGSYSVCLSGWCSNSIYAIMGSLRAMSQVIAYEIVISTIIVLIILISNSLSFIEISLSQRNLYNCFTLNFFFICYFICILIECNRAPFDLPETESELVSGFNVEYSGILFALFFAAEYKNMVLMGATLVLFFLGGFNKIYFLSILPGYFIFIFKTVLVSILTFLWPRATLPRFKYNDLLLWSWKVILPLVFTGLLLILYWIILLN